MNTSWGVNNNNNRNYRNNNNNNNYYQNRRQTQTQNTRHVTQVPKTLDISNAEFPVIASSHMKPVKCNKPSMYSDKYLQSISVTITNLTPDSNTKPDNNLEQYEQRCGWPNTIIKKSAVEIHEDTRATDNNNKNALMVLNGLNLLYFNRLFQYVELYNQNTHKKYLDVESVVKSMCKTFNTEFIDDDDDQNMYDSEYDE